MATTSVGGAELVQPDELLRSIERTAELLRSIERTRSIEPIPADDPYWSWVRRSHVSFERVKEIERSPWLRAAAAVRAAAGRGDPAPPLAAASLRESG